MNIEMNNNLLIKSWSHIRRHFRRLTGAVRATAHQPAETVNCSSTRNMKEAGIRREQYHAQSIAQLQQNRFFR